jgi:hypothetical protein
VRYFRACIELFFLYFNRDKYLFRYEGGAMGTAFQFLTVFLKKCGSKQEDVDYRPLFENFLQVQSTY